MFLRYFSIFFVFFLSVTANAVPAKPVKKTMVRADGTVAEVTLCGDEHFSFYKDAAGMPYVKGANGRLMPTTNEFIDNTWTEIKDINLKRAGRHADARKSPRKVGTSSSVTTGKVRGLVILMQFTDMQFSMPDANAFFNRFFNEPGFSDYSMVGSVQDYFKSQSYGQLEIDFDVVGPFTTKHDMAYYGSPRGNSNDSNPVGMVAEAVDAASAVVNFTPYDWDNDGEVDQVFVVYAGYNQAQGADENTIWPHESQLVGWGLGRNYNGKVINTYGCSSELMGDGKRNTGIPDGIGTACHEFSHCLGLPDMYDTSTNGNFGMCIWDIMDQGSYNQSSRIPAGYTAYERIFSKWMTPTEIKSQTTITDMKPLAEAPEAYILYNDNYPDEYYLLENRQPVGFDKGLYGHGLLVVHVDYSKSAWASNSVNTTNGHQRMTIIPADNSLSYTYNELQGDPWPGITGNRELSNYTKPAAEVYNTNTDGSKFMNKSIDNITENNTTHTVSFVACRPPLSQPQPGEGTQVGDQAAFTVTWPAVSGAASYELELTEIGAASTDPENSIVQKYTFDKCVSKSAGFTDISSKLGEYGLAGWSGSKLFTTPNKLRIGTSSTAGTLRTPTWEVPASSEFTIVIGVDVVKEGTVKGRTRLGYGNQGDQATYDDRSFSFSGPTYLVFNYNVRKNLFFFIIEPDVQMYINYFAVYDGTWSIEQLGLSNANSGFADMSSKVRKKTEVKYFTSDTNSYTFTNLNLSNRYFYRVRAKGAAGNLSQWSEEKMFVFTTEGIEGVASSPADGMVSVYDVSGRLIHQAPASRFSLDDIDIRGLLIIKDARGSRKIMLK